MRPHGAVETAAWLLWLACVGADEQRRFAAMDAVPVLEARWYPPLVFDAVPANPLGRRQDVLSCPPGYHNCLDVGSGGSCCTNGSYCIIDRQGMLRCCSLGSTCSNQTDCDSGKYQCNSTRTVTTTASGGATSTGTETIAACCGRQCRTSSFRCPVQMGGGCCGYGGTCASNSGCIVARSQDPTGFVPQVPEGCTTSQITCPSSIGGGCCPVGRSCTQAGSSVGCATVPVAPPDGVISVGQDGGGGGMSAGAKAGIAVGVVLGSAIIIGVATWLCIRKRHSPTDGSRSLSQIQGASGGGSGYGAPRSRASVPTNGGGGGGSAIGAGSERGGALSGTASEARFLTADYFVPDAVAGPYTDLESPTTQLEATTPGFDRGVPLEPIGPNHIVAPVELDSGRSVSAKSDVTSPSRVSNLDARAFSMYSQAPAAGPDDVHSRFELHGSDTPEIQGREVPRGEERNK